MVLRAPRSLAKALASASTFLLAALPASALAALPGRAPNSLPNSLPGRAQTGLPAHAAAEREASERALLRSHELWATINVCSPKNRLDTVGIRGSMPGDGIARDRMYMTFRLQYMETASRRWIDLARAVSPSWVPVGAGSSARQGGFSFTLRPMSGKPAVTLRGIVDFQWRRGKTVRVSAARPTSASHKSVTGADPAGYSAATCAVS